MGLRQSKFLLIIPLAFGCSRGPYPAPVDAVVTILPAAATLAPSQSTKDPLAMVGRDQEGLPPQGVMLWARAVVTDSDPPLAYENSQLPLTNIQVEIRTSASTICVLPTESVWQATPPEIPDDIDDIQAACAEEWQDWCAWYWDADSESFYQLYDTYVAYPGDTSDTGYDDPYCPNFLLSSTDSSGGLDFYVFVDALPHSVDSESGSISWSNATVSAYITNDSADLTISTTSG